MDSDTITALTDAISALVGQSAIKRFLAAKRSILGLDKLARAKKEDHLRKRNEGQETPGPGVSDSVRKGIQKFQAEKYRDERRGLVADSRDRDRDRDRRDRGDDRDSRNRDKRKDPNRSDRRDEKRGHKEYETPNFKVPFTPSRYGWDDDDRPVPKSSWDTPSPKTLSSSRRGDLKEVSEEFVEKREKQWVEKTSRPRLTLKQQSIKRENELWENNRLHRSGVVALTDELSSVFDDETDENRVSLLVHNIVPPFLDGRIVFTRQSKP